MKQSEEDPRLQGLQPPFAQPKQPYPGYHHEMQLKADHGEESYRGCGKLTGKAAIVTGGDSGIGRAVCLAFAREGADVLISYLSEHADAEETGRLVEDAGQKAVLFPGDVGDEAHCRALIERAVAEFGRLDILVNNAAYQKTFPSLADTPTSEIEKTFRTNILAIFYLCKEALPVMGKGGSIINTTSIQAYDPSPSLLSYAATKGAIVTFTKGLAQEAIAKGIRVNAVAPGPVWTPLIPATLPAESVHNFGKDALIGRPAQPVEMAPIYVLLASDEASYLTAHIFPATGGKPTA